MKLNLCHRDTAFTRTELLVVIVTLAVLIGMLLPVYIASRQRGGEVNCAGLVKQIGLSFRLWAMDNGDKFPMEISVANGGTRELIATGNIVSTFQVISNQLLDPTLLHCPRDTDHSAFPLAPGPQFIHLIATNFSGDLKNHISYFIGLDASANNPSALLSGDDNFEIGDMPVKPSLLEISKSTSIAWTSARHTTHKRHLWDATTSFGNVGLADGSVQQTTISSRTNLVQRSTGTVTTSLTSLLRATGVATNRLAIP